LRFAPRHHTPFEPTPGAVAIRVPGEGDWDITPSPPLSTMCDAARTPRRPRPQPRAGREPGAPREFLPSSPAAFPCLLPLLLLLGMLYGVCRLNRPGDASAPPRCADRARHPRRCGQHQPR
jgi:hypothetical protein